MFIKDGCYNIDMVTENLVIQNPWWKNPSAIGEDEKVKEALSKEQKVIYTFDLAQNNMILGPRQTGKTTMLKLFVYDLIKKGINPRNILYFSCEPLNEKKDIISFFSEFDAISAELKGKKYIFLDEVTQIKNWELAVKYFLETETSKNKLLVVTGSNAFLLRKGTERLPGRDIDTRLFLPLSFREFLLKFGSEGLRDTLMRTKYGSLADLDKIYSQSVCMLPFLNEVNSKFLVYLKTGGYLKPIYEFLEKGKISEDTYEIYVKWILGDLSKLDRRESIFKSTVRGITKRYSSKFSLLSFAKEMEIPSHTTVSDYLETLQSLLLVNNLYQVDLGKGVPVFRKERKCYFLDPFLYSVFKGYGLGKYQDYSEGSEDLLVEGVVCEALSRLGRQYLSTDHFLWFFVKKNETDFVVKTDGSPLGIEVKWQDKVGKSDFRNFHSFRKRILLSRKNLEKNEDILIIPTPLFLCLLS